MRNKAKIKDMISGERLQLRVIAALCAGVTGFAAILYFSNQLLFQRFIGNANPILVFVVASLLGIALLSLLLSRGWFAIYKKATPSGLLRSSALAALFGLIMILVDTQVRFPADMNVPFPESLLFYPAIDFLAQIIFHVLPLAVLMITLTSIFRNANHKTIIWVCVLAISLLEPIYQAAWSSSNQLPLWAAAYVVLHVFLINLTELIIFRRYDFVSMYAFRLVYYVFWHIGWGYARLDILF